MLLIFSFKCLKEKVTEEYIEYFAQRNILLKPVYMSHEVNQINAERKYWWRAKKLALAFWIIIKFLSIMQHHILESTCVWSFSTNNIELVETVSVDELWPSPQQPSLC